MRKAKYLHIIWHPDLKFIPYLVKMIHEETAYFDAKDHVFVTPHKRVYERLAENYEIYLDGTEEENLINRFGEYGDWIFVHAINCSRKVLLQTKTKYAKKVIWRTWGHDVRPLVQSDSKALLPYLVKYVSFALYKHKVRQFHAIGIANDVDAVNVHNTFGNMPTVTLNYSYDPDLDQLLEIKKPEKIQGNPIRILIGHSRSPLDCHMDVLKRLLPYSNENIQVCLILSYGGPKEYGEEVKAYASRHYGDKIEVIEDFMEKEQYIRYLSTIDVAIFPQMHSAALGNLTWLLHFDIPVFVTEKGQFAESFRRNGCQYCDLDFVGIIPFRDFIHMKNSDALRQKYGMIKSSQDVCATWKQYLATLK